MLKLHLEYTAILYAFKKIKHVFERIITPVINTFQVVTVILSLIDAVSSAEKNVVGKTSYMAMIRDQLNTR